MKTPDLTKVTACGILLISADNKILAFARKGNISKLGLPAGKREHGEDLKSCAEREVFEETGVKIDLNDINEVFYFIPDDKQANNIEEFCATYIVRSKKYSETFVLAEANKDESGEIEGVSIWVSPEEFISKGSSAFINYNTNLLKFAGFIV